MKIYYNKQRTNSRQKLLCVTHTERPVDLDRCNINFLTKRFSDSTRLPPPVPFESLTPSSNHTPYLGDITIWEFVGDDFRTPRLLAHMNPKEYKPQFALWYKQRLWVLGVEIIEIYDSTLSRLAVIKDPWLSGAHTIVPDQTGHLLVSCSASDSVLVIDEATYEVVQTRRMPQALYGFNYPLSRKDSVVDHYIINDYQLTHLNCAWPWRNGILVSTLIQGAIGWFDYNGNYKELLRGFIGCHGSRVTREDQIYFCDSCLGSVVFLTPEFGSAHRLDTGSLWLHDAHELSCQTFALSVPDRNQVEIMNSLSEEVLGVIPCGDFGEGTQFVYYGE